MVPASERFISLWEKQAIKASLIGVWEEAIKLNQKILQYQPKNIPALNRLGRAFWKKGNLAEARKTYSQTLKIDRYHPIASKNLKRLNDLGRIKKATPKKAPPLSEAFLEEPGKTKTVKLTRLADSKVLSELDSGDLIKLVPKKRTVSIVREDGIYLGSLPEDLSLRLLRLIKGGNRYQAFVQSVNRQHLEIFIREVFRSPRLKNLPSFTPGGLQYIPFLSPATIHEEKPKVSPTGKEEADEG